MDVRHSLHTQRTASVNFLDGTKIEQQRILLAVYPLLYVLPRCFPRRSEAVLMKGLTRLAFQPLLLHSGVDDLDPVKYCTGADEGDVCSGARISMRSFIFLSFDLLLKCAACDLSMLSGR